MNDERSFFIASLLGLCPALAVSDLVGKALGLGAALTAVLVVAGVSLPLLARLVPHSLRPVLSLASLAALVNLADLGMQALAPNLRRQLGIYLPVLAVNCLILARLESFARSRSVARSVLEALARGAKFTAVLVLMAAIREALGSGALSLPSVGRFDGVIRIPGLSRHPVRVMSLAAGALLLAGYLSALSERLRKRGPDPERGSSR